MRSGTIRVLRRGAVATDPPTCQPADGLVSGNARHSPQPEHSTTRTHHNPSAPRTHRNVFVALSSGITISHRLVNDGDRLFSVPASAQRNWPLRDRTPH
jgi:hypothetical protein